MGLVAGICLFSQNCDKLGTKFLRDGSQDIRKDKESTLLAIKVEILKGKLYFRFACENPSSKRNVLE